MQGSIGTLHCDYLTYGLNSSAQAHRLDRVAASGLAAELDRALDAALGADQAVYLLRTVEAELALRADGTDTARRWGRALATAIITTLADAPGDSSNVIRFADEAEYLAAYLAEHVRGQAARHWYFRPLQPFHTLPPAEATAALLADHPLDSVLAALYRHGTLTEVLDALAEPSLARLAGLSTGQDPPAPAAGDEPAGVWPLAAAAVRVADAWSLWTGEPWPVAEAAEGCRGRSLPTWGDARSLTLFVVEVLRDLMNRGAVRTPVCAPPPGLSAGLEWLQMPLLVEKLTAMTESPRTRPRGARAVGGEPPVSWPLLEAAVRVADVWSLWTDVPRSAVEVANGYRGSPVSEWSDFAAAPRALADVLRHLAARSEVRLPPGTPPPPELTAEFGWLDLSVLAEALAAPPEPGPVRTAQQAAAPRRADDDELAEAWPLVAAAVQVANAWSLWTGEPRAVAEMATGRRGRSLPTWGDARSLTLFVVEVLQDLMNRGEVRAPDCAPPSDLGAGLEWLQVPLLVEKLTTMAGFRPAPTRAVPAGGDKPSGRGALLEAAVRVADAWSLWTGAPRPAAEVAGSYRERPVLEWSDSATVTRALADVLRHLAAHGHLRLPPATTPPPELAAEFGWLDLSVLAEALAAPSEPKGAGPAQQATIPRRADDDELAKTWPLAAAAVRVADAWALWTGEPRPVGEVAAGYRGRSMPNWDDARALTLFVVEVLQDLMGRGEVRMPVCAPPPGLGAELDWLQVPLLVEELTSAPEREPSTAQVVPTVDEEALPETQRLVEAAVRVANRWSLWMGAPRSVAEVAGDYEGSPVPDRGDPVSSTRALGEVLRHLATEGHLRLPPDTPPPPELTAEFGWLDLSVLAEALAAPSEPGRAGPAQQATEVVGEGDRTPAGARQVLEAAIRVADAWSLWAGPPRSAEEIAPGYRACPNREDPEEGDVTALTLCVLEILRHLASRGDIRLPPPTAAVPPELRVLYEWMDLPLLAAELNGSPTERTPPPTPEQAAPPVPVREQAVPSALGQAVPRTPKPAIPPTQEQAVREALHQLLATLSPTGTGPRTVLLLRAALADAHPEWADAPWVGALVARTVAEHGAALHHQTPPEASELIQDSDNAGLLLLLRGVSDLRIPALLSRAGLADTVPATLLAVGMRLTGAGSDDAAVRAFAGPPEAPPATLETWRTMDDDQCATVRRALETTAQSQHLTGLEEQPATVLPDGLLGAGAEAADEVLGLIALAVLRTWSRWLVRLAEADVPFLLRHFVRRPGRLRWRPGELLVELRPNPMDIVVRTAGYDQPFHDVPWLGVRRVTYRVGT